MTERWVPSQYKVQETPDFRNAKLGPKGFKEKTKRKLEEMQEQLAHEEETAMDQDEPQPVETQSIKRRKADGVNYVPVYEREAKAPAERAAKIMKAGVTSSWEKKMKNKASRQMFMEHKREAVNAMKEKKKADVEHRKMVRERRKANQEKSAVVQKITNSATLKKMMKNKKQKKSLKMADTN
mmetsp:Transcript_8508/g.18174  ORF Transcript_8508/g.18174 Transcript_8508/m.18174 type:complete len:182 (-) Transcript_8508:629-1174(-)|eukprot:CAMPEP_0202894710 /NCGR_PEP_ID=MMETSP1392-20130828/4053_1 /ASSEMBLY_ACC=CAM_ASM_000868 /TAXON_ID=225041 /ORGANISM="Chlamydomonas chlamydogama, Strain SAG 11-48b" /LENGTH=181 /DNA_ID=CAMNT_0049579479 /DNA_START=98 /DNA_END=643 /DNA_ORIENTATION=-